MERQTVRLSRSLRMRSPMHSVKRASAIVAIPTDGGGDHQKIRQPLVKTERISLAAARRIALAAQGFGQRKEAARTATQLSRTLRHTHLLQIDSVNVLVRAHYMPIYSRTGSYDRSFLDRAAWGAAFQAAPVRILGTRGLAAPP